MTDNNKPLVLYHGHCMDGFTAAWCAYRYFKSEGIEAQPVNYNDTDETRNSLIERAKDRLVFILDFSYPIDVLQRFMESARSISLVDHHKTARDDMRAWLYEGVPEGRDVIVSRFEKHNLTVQFDMERSGAGMASDLFFGRDNRSWLVDYVEDRDIWTWKLPDSRLINAFLIHQKPSFERWDELAEMDLSVAAEAGRIAKTIIDDYIDGAMHSARICEFVVGHDGKTILAPVINSLYWHTSEICEKLASTPMRLVKGYSVQEAIEAYEPGTEGSVEQAPFAASWYVAQDGLVRYSFRSRDTPDGEAFDVSALAKMYGGGGHHRAAGLNIGRPIHNPCPGGPEDIVQARM